MAVKSYDPKKVSLVIGPHAASGYMKGTFIELEFDSDAFTKVVGSDGEVARSKSNDYAGALKLTLMQTSDTNDYLSSLAILDRASGTGVVPVLLRDALGRTLASSTAGWVKKIPKIGFGQEIEAREWVLDLAQLDVFVGGN